MDGRTDGLLSLEALAAAGTPMRYDAGTVIYRQGEPCGAVYLIEDGAAKLVRSETRGREVIVALRYPGWLLGVATAIIGGEHPATAITVGPCSARVISVDALTRLRRSELGVSDAVVHLLARDLSLQVESAGRMGLPPPERLERALVELGCAFGHRQPDGSAAFYLPISQEELAAIVGVTREHVNRMLRGLQRAGRIQRRAGQFILPTWTGGQPGRR